VLDVEAITVSIPLRQKSLRFDRPGQKRMKTQPDPTIIVVPRGGDNRDLILKV
jgi:hypothetical protein